MTSPEPAHSAPTQHAAGNVGNGSVATVVPTEHPHTRLVIIRTGPGRGLPVRRARQPYGGNGNGASAN